MIVTKIPKILRINFSRADEYKYSMSCIDILSKLVKFEIINSTDEWSYFKKLRNLLTHEYLNNENEIVEGIKERLGV